VIPVAVRGHVDDPMRSAPSTRMPVVLSCRLGLSAKINSAPLLMVRLPIVADASRMYLPDSSTMCSAWFAVKEVRSASRCGQL